MHCVLLFKMDRICMVYITNVNGNTSIIVWTYMIQECYNHTLLVNLFKIYETAKLQSTNHIQDRCCHDRGVVCRAFLLETFIKLC